MFQSRRDREQISAIQADLSSLRSRLDADVSNLSDAGDPACRQALSDAAERSTSAGGLMTSSHTAQELQIVRRTLIEGLTATRFVREKQGLPLGPDLPTNEQGLEGPTTVDVAGQQHVAYPDYHPERPHFFGGSNQAPAGYYRTPFWQKALAVGGAVMGAEMLGDAMGGLLGGGGDRDYGDGGYNDGGDGGGDWG